MCVLTNIYTVPCPLCGNDKRYATERNMIVCRDKLCRSCANSIGRGGIGSVKPVDGKKRCIDCSEHKDIKYFNKTRVGKIYSVCIECSKIRSIDYHTKHYKYAKYGISKEIYTEMMISQGHRCKICNSYEPLFIDHNHETGKVRGLLCRQCNSAIGFLRDDLTIIENALKYLKES